MQGASEEKTHAGHAQAMEESEFVNPWTNTANLVPHGAAVEQTQATAHKKITVAISFKQ
jgi:hypothetical protein